MPAPVELKRITKDYGDFRALSDVDLTIYPGVTGLLGPNGAGKSTLIKVLLGMVVRINAGVDGAGISPYYSFRRDSHTYRVYARRRLLRAWTIGN